MKCGCRILGSMDKMQPDEGLFHKRDRLNHELTSYLFHASDSLRDRLDAPRNRRRRSEPAKRHSTVTHLKDHTCRIVKGRHCSKSLQADRQARPARGAGNSGRRHRNREPGPGRKNSPNPRHDPSREKEGKPAARRCDHGTSAARPDFAGRSLRQMRRQEEVPPISKGTAARRH